ncbi:MAG TPA: helix-turn-helix domain-containing protein [Planctomycetota bacterium]|nr:helix-turn-helix domain-containing protein [Planctomycetota bacterium]
MPATTFYTVQQVAAITELSDRDILKYIEAGALRANFNQGNMSYLILQDDLLMFMREQRLTDQIQKIMQKRVLVVDRDTNTTFILKSELERGGKVIVRVATSTRDVELSLDANVPDVMTMHFAATQRAQDNLEGVLRRCRAMRPTMLVLYHDQPEQMIKTSPEIQKVVTSLQVEGLVSVARGFRPLVQKIEELLGLDRSATIVRKPAEPG